MILPQFYRQNYLFHNNRESPNPTIKSTKTTEITIAATGVFEGTDMFDSVLVDILGIFLCTVAVLSLTCSVPFVEFSTNAVLMGSFVENIVSFCVRFFEDDSVYEEDIRTTT